MPRAWTCTRSPSHGTFLQAGIEALQREHTWAQRGMDVLAGSEGKDVFKRVDRLACPLCCAAGLSGWVRPATDAEIASLNLPAATAA